MVTPGEQTATVLVVEDVAVVSMVAVQALTEAGYSVLEAFNGDEALEVLNHRDDVRVVFTDVRMPGTINGYTLARIIDMRWPGIGVIVTSANALPGPGDLPQQASFLAKPYTPSFLLDLVRTLLSPAGAGKPSTVHRPAARPQGASEAPFRLDECRSGAKA